MALTTDKLFQRRRRRVRTAIAKNSGGRLRLSVFRSSKNIHAQIIDDAAGKTLAAATSTSKALAEQLKGKTKSEKAKIVGTELAKKAKEAGIEAVVFDRGFARYHGRVKALADACREGGLKF